MKNPDEQPKAFFLSYNDIGQYLFEALVDNGYAPSEDEILDLSDIVMDLVLQVHVEMGGTAELLISEEDEEELGEEE